jgi:hypothetical protein
LRNEEEEEEDLETTKKKRERKKKNENYHISTQMSQNSKKQESKYDNTKILVFMFKFQTRKMQKQKKNGICKNLPSYIRVAEKFGCHRRRRRMLQIRAPLACLVLLSSISMSSVQENCVHFSHSATCSVFSHNTSSLTLL